jgi:glycosyltransferase involved in cell wall biosynthesis
MQFQYTFTVFTPTYNRAHSLERVYESLSSQSFRDFEWLVVDDGSNDNTRKLIMKWSAEASFTIRYLFQTNQGKHVAFNRAVHEAKGMFFLVADSDDWFVPEALERFRYYWLQIPGQVRDQFTGVTCLCMDQGGVIIGTRFPDNPTDSDSLEIRYRYRVSGEKWGFHRTDVLRQFPFPVQEGMKYVPEGIVWGRIARRYKTRFINETLRIYAGDAGNQLTKRTPREAAFLRIYYAEVMSNELDFFIDDPWSFVKIAVHYVRFSFLAGDGVCSQLWRLKGVGSWLLWLAALMPGAIVAIRDLAVEKT